MSETRQWETKDTGNHMEFASGMKRDSQEGKARFDLLMPLDVPYEEQLLTRWANLMERACRDKYEERNWEQADSVEEMARMKSSAFRHFMQWMAGVDDGEDHAAGAMFNLLAHETTAYKVRREDRPAPKLDSLVREESVFEVEPERDFLVAGDIVDLLPQRHPLHALTGGCTYEVLEVSHNGLYITITNDDLKVVRISASYFRLYTPKNQKENPAA